MKNTFENTLSDFFAFLTVSESALRQRGMTGADSHNNTQMIIAQQDKFNLLQQKSRRNEE